LSIRKKRSITTFDEEYWEQIRRAIEALSVGLPSPPTVDWRPRLDLMTWANVDDEMTIVERVSGDLSLLRQLTTGEVVSVEQRNLTAVIDSLLKNEGMRCLLVDRAQELGIKLAWRSTNPLTLRIDKSCI
jgi:hypothetical protein